VKSPKVLEPKVDPDAEAVTNDDAIRRALFTLHEELMREQVDLPAEERALIYSNLWDLYE